MTTKTKIFVALACVVAAFYLLEIVLTVAAAGVTGPVAVKALIVGALVYYVVFQVRKAKAKGG
jgi:hypothetical protein